MEQRLFARPPIFVGGIGGSGTRVLAALLKNLDYSIGEDLNDALDNLWFTALFKRRAMLGIGDSEFLRHYSIFRTACSGRRFGDAVDWQKVEIAMLAPREQHSTAWLQCRLESFFLNMKNLQPKTSWGWKEPNSHIFARRILAFDPEIRYIHLTRNGLDMAFGENQNQPRFWGGLVIADDDRLDESARSLKYWCWAERRMCELQRRLPERILRLRFEDFFDCPDMVARKLSSYLGDSKEHIASLLGAVVAYPSSIGRFRRFGTNHFCREDLQFASSLGFPIE